MSENKIMDQVLNELESARNNHEDFNSRWEGFCVLQEELCELWGEVRKKEPPKKFMREEATQVAAMAIKFIEDCCETKEKLCHRCDGTGLFVNSSSSVCGTCKGSGRLP